MAFFANALGVDVRGGSYNTVIRSKTNYYGNLLWELHPPGQLSPKSFPQLSGKPSPSKYLALEFILSEDDPAISIPNKNDLKQRPDRVLAPPPTKFNAPIPYAKNLPTTDTFLDVAVTNLKTKLSPRAFPTEWIQEGTEYNGSIVPAMISNAKITSEITQAAFNMFRLQYIFGAPISQPQRYLYRSALWCQHSYSHSKEASEVLRHNVNWLSCISSSGRFEPPASPLIFHRNSKRIPAGIFDWYHVSKSISQQNNQTTGTMRRADSKTLPTPDIIFCGVSDSDGRGRDGGGAWCGVGHNVYIVSTILGNGQQFKHITLSLMLNNLCNDRNVF